jgi:hypothetical protein
MTVESSTDRLVRDYLDLLKRSVSGRTLGLVRYYRPLVGPADWKRRLIDRMLPDGHEVAASSVFDARTNDEGKTWVAELPPGVITMIGQRRLDHLESCVADIIKSHIPGDLIETGVWRGGATIFMKGVLRAYGDTERVVYAADSFAGLPAPDADRYPADRGADFHLQPELAVGLEEVRANFERYGLLDDRVQFLKGWFRDTLPGLRGHRWALIRLDGDLYESTMDGLSNLYAGLQPGGYIIIDDYGNVPACRQAVDDFRAANAIDEPVTRIDWGGVFWQRVHE